MSAGHSIAVDPGSAGQGPGGGRPASRSPPPILEVKGLRTEFHTRRATVRAVDDVTFSVHEGERVGIMGETGCGKSVTIRSILGLVRPPGRVEAGSAVFAGSDLLKASGAELQATRGRSIGFIPQNPWGALNPIYRVRRQFANVLRLDASVPSERRESIAGEMLRRVEIVDPRRVLRAHAHELSGGMAQRVVIAMALSRNPRLVIADEPTTALDVTVQRSVLDLIDDLVTSQRRALLIVTHDLGIISQYCDRAVVMFSGRVMESGPVRTVFSSPSHPYTRDLLSSVRLSVRDVSGREQGVVPAPAKRGCPYSTRCVHAEAQCARETPGLAWSTDRARAVACHFPLSSPD